jgi:AraC family transcriptional regulator
MKPAKTAGFFGSHFTLTSSYLNSMIFHEFPDLTWLKNQIADGFSNRRGWGNIPLDTEGFPSVIINAKVRECFRPDIRGPFSFFLNIRGNSLCAVDRQTTLIDEDNYFVSNRSQHYTLRVEENSGGAETFNIHFGEFFSESVLNSLVTPADRILDGGTEKQLSPISFFNQLHRRDATFNSLIRAILTAHQEKRHNKLRLEEQMTSLLSYHLEQHRHIAERVNNLPPVRRSTRIELYKRLSRAMDVLYSGFCGEISLDQLAVEASLSKYHFLRLFRTAYGLSPYQYIQQLRIEKARVLLADTAIPITDLSALLGFDNSQSFSRLFFQRMGLYPTQYRLRLK